MLNLKKIISKKKYRFLYVIFFLLLFNSFLEAISIGILLPFLSFTFNDAGNQNINEYFEFILNFFNLESSSLSFLYILFGIYVFKYIYIFWYSRIQANYLGNLKTELQMRMYGGYLDQPFQFHTNINSSVLIRNITAEISKFINQFLSPLLQIFLHTLMVTFIIIMLLIINYKVTLIVMLIFSVCFLTITLIFSKKLNRIGERHQYHDRFIFQYLRQGLVGMIETKILSLQKLYLDKFFHHTDNIVKLGITRYMIGISPKIFFEFVFLTIIFSAVIFTEKAQNFSTEDVILTLIIYAAAAIRVMPSLGAISQAYYKIKYAGPSTKLIYEEFRSFDENKVKKESFKNDSLKTINFNNSIIIKDMSFSYNDKEVIKNLNFEIKKKENIGIIGGNGSGKSTLLSLICGLLIPTKGTIKIDGLDAGKNFEGYVKLIGYIPQNIHLIDDTIEKNISLGADIFKDKKEKLMSVIKKAQLEKLISTLPEGMDTFIGEHGSKLSGGEKQKIGIARALYRDPEILIFDEVTSAMDLESEKKFVEEINKEYSDKTIIIVSHRLSALKYCKKIFNMDNQSEKLVTKI